MLNRWKQTDFGTKWANWHQLKEEVKSNISKENRKKFSFKYGINKTTRNLLIFINYKRHVWKDQFWDETMQTIAY